MSQRRAGVRLDIGNAPAAVDLAEMVSDVNIAVVARVAVADGDDVRRAAGADLQGGGAWVLRCPDGGEVELADLIIAQRWNGRTAGAAPEITYNSHFSAEGS